MQFRFCTIYYFVHGALPGDKPACSRFPRLVLFHLSALSIERLKISINLTVPAPCGGSKKIGTSLYFFEFSLCPLDRGYFICYNYTVINYSVIIAKR